jgi:ABC-type multidrug transport system ATPase subunit
MSRADCSDTEERPLSEIVPFSSTAPSVRTVEAHDLTCDFGRLRALHRVHFRLQSGQALAVLGPNGAGKSTLLSVLATLQRPTRGRVIFDEKADGWYHREVVRRHVGLVAHDLLAWPELSGRETLKVHAGLRGVQEEAVERWILWTGLGEAADRPIDEYSRGMKQRLAIARALLHDPSVVLLDEPMTGLDRRAANEMYALVRSLRRAGRIVVMITHTLEAPRDVFDRALVLDRGRLVFDGVVEDSLLACYEAALRREGP